MINKVRIGQGGGQTQAAESSLIITHLHPVCHHMRVLCPLPQTEPCRATSNSCALRRSFTSAVGTNTQQLSQRYGCRENHPPVLLFSKSFLIMLTFPAEAVCDCCCTNTRPTCLRPHKTMAAMFLSPQDGGLFTFGDGSWGQLGHGSTNNELLPRRVLELMGTEVSQITCGRYARSSTW